MLLRIEQNQCKVICQIALQPNCPLTPYLPMVVDSVYIRSFLIILLALMVLLGMFIMGKTLSQVQARLAIALALGFVTFVVAFFNTQVALYVLIFSMLLSPEIVIAKTSAREVTIRVDDLILGIISFTWLAKMALNQV